MMCTCGRTKNHCRFCGSKSVYGLLGPSEDKGVLVSRCKKCMKRSSELDPCTAPLIETKQIEEAQAIKDPVAFGNNLLAKGKPVQEVINILKELGLDVSVQDGDKKEESVSNQVSSSTEEPPTISVEEVIARSRKKKE
jgi:hypothetical protein